MANETNDDNVRYVTGPRESLSDAVKGARALAKQLERTVTLVYKGGETRVTPTSTASNTTAQARRHAKHK